MEVRLVISNRLMRSIHLTGNEISKILTSDRGGSGFEVERIRSEPLLLVSRESSDAILRNNNDEPSLI